MSIKFSNINHSIVIRHADETDSMRLAELAQRDSAAAPEGETVIAEADGRMVAAVVLADERLIADPFEHTSEAAALLMLRAQQIRGARRTARRRRTVMRTPVASATGARRRQPQFS